MTESGNFGVYNQTEGFQTPDNSFLLYRLDENFAPVEQLLEMPGNERRRVDYPEFTLFLPSDFLSKTFWDVDDEWFYYITSYQPSVNKYNLKTGDKKVVSFFQFQERFNNSDYANSLKKRYNSIKDEQYWDVLENSQTLPLFSGFWVQDNKITLRMFYPAGEDGMMIYIDQGTDEIKYFEMPHEFYQQFLHDDKIYGIDYNEDDYSRLMFINLHSR